MKQSRIVTLMAPKLAICVVLFLIILQFIYLYSQNSSSGFYQHQFKLRSCPNHNEVHKIIDKIFAKGGIFWNENDMEKLQEFKVIEFGVWQSQQLEKKLKTDGINYKHLFYKDVQDSLCPHNQGDVFFDDFEQGKYEAADFVVSRNSLHFVPDVDRYLQQLMSLTKVNRSAIIIDDPYFFGPRAHRLYGQWLNILLDNFKCKPKHLNYEDERGVVKEYSHLQQPNEFKELLDAKFENCGGLVEFVVQFVAQQEKRRVPIEELCGIIHKQFDVQIQTIKLYYDKIITNDTALEWQQGFEKNIQQRWSYGKYFGDAVILVIQKKG
eukprot:TRINITY_DN6817_c1_g1_i1.p1 TRINITY_DN6817_c1_g1~~TRINITY_DN6817_c1_g1_i1.p1  ORF type:complete len:323 (+),score=27.42 TRINITY_DN6817_c1_g1_i1:182-1150(+)